nr:G-type lectin S-receptor-like serine/threonine-protein kinase At4g27290 [Tanacetum cinerariifolium]
MELPLCSFATIAKATDSFSPNNKIGEGGFGSVYKGTFENGQEVAVKRLSGKSTQGYEEFKNEVICISKLQHRNLVKLLGWSIKRYTNLLIYEYMPNGSLDTFIFDSQWRNAMYDEYNALVKNGTWLLVPRPAGVNMQFGVDFDETFTIRTVLSLAVSCKWPIHQLDVKNAFLNGDLSETVYMHQPPGFVDASVLHVMPHEPDFITVVAILL